MVHLWKVFHNPFFPFFNGLFHSTDFLSYNWRDERFLPKTLVQIIFYPFYFSFNGKLIADAPFQDVRFAIIYILSLIYLVKLIWIKMNNHLISNDLKSNLLSVSVRCPDIISKYLIQWFLIFCLFSYITWQFYFSIARYLAALEMLAPLIIYLLLKPLILNRLPFYLGLFSVYYFIAYLMSPLPMIRVPWYDASYFNIQLPHSIKNINQATVLMTYTAYVRDRNPRPQTYLIPFFPTHWQFLGIPFWDEHYLQDEQHKKTIIEKIEQTKNPIYLLTAETQMHALLDAAKGFNLKQNGRCDIIESDRQLMTPYKVLLCPVRKS